ncbi:hypothetical protein ACROYT_G015432 [Oculina patagonica]
MVKWDKTKRDVSLRKSLATEANIKSTDSSECHVRQVQKKKKEGAVTAGKYLTGICVDFNKLFLRYEVHLVESRGLSIANRALYGVSVCELNECREAAEVARLSRRPAFECIHLQSVQYGQPYQQPITLTETSLDDLAGKKFAWFKDSKKQECLSLKDNAQQGGYPLIAHFPGSKNKKG